MIIRVHNLLQTKLALSGFFSRDVLAPRGYKDFEAHPAFTQNQISELEDLRARKIIWYESLGNSAATPDALEVPSVESLASGITVTPLSAQDYTPGVSFPTSAKGTPVYAANTGPLPANASPTAASSLEAKVIGVLSESFASGDPLASVLPPWGTMTLTSTEWAAICDDTPVVGAEYFLSTLEGGKPVSAFGGTWMRAQSESEADPIAWFTKVFHVLSYTGTAVTVRVLYDPQPEGYHAA